jgi:maleate isomerase
VPVAQLEQMTRDVAKERPDAITIICTNLRAAPSVAKLEGETGIPIYDTIATVVWKCLRMAGVDTRRVTNWGSLFQQLV